MKWFSVLVVIGMIVASCGSGSDVLVLASSDSGSEISIESDDRFEIRLESNPSTGFSWQLDQETLDGVVELKSQTFEAPEDSDLVGAPGTDVFEFEAIARGAGVLRLEYVRLSDDPSIPDRIVEYIVRVDDAPWPPDDGSTEPPSTTTASVPDPADTVIEVSALFDGEGPRDAVIVGFVIWDDASARLCETIMESFPPQCGGMSLVIADPQNLDVELEEAQGVRWTADRIELAATFDGNRLIINATDTEPTDSDQAVINAFLAFVADPTSDTAAGLPLAPEVAIGLGPEIITTRTADELSDPAAWQLDREEFRAWAGPFSALDFATEPVTVTVGAHPRCASPPEPAPIGFAEHRRISIQPIEATSCLEWWTVDFFIDNDGNIAAATLDLFAP